ncbi:ABC transporter permease [Streptomyces turgidiscabies]|uniref:Efflux ABC transporter, permease protein n=2 Tax=Streptomyces TaxID=1883 RepID=L7F645_STRT8|nr:MULTISPECIES: ABC transporter permease [Streptomyces]ELP66777.1 efflux ABC transporter, permease protein [Streptomyces turgidiscabies Car8]MDX3500051.1 FtsX-like permease family protein [Streptomyces turgidiscabies]GAQ73754.1 macrolide export ATP-binding/permease protein [Streptomyces turgidiscabies]
MFRTALRNVLAHKARLLMTLLAVILGVAFVSGTLIFSDTYKSAYGSQAAKSYAHVDVQVVENTDYSGENTGISRKTFDEIARLDGVADAAGRVEGSASVADRDGGLISAGMFNAGANFAPGKSGKDRLYEFTDGSGPTEPGQVALDKRAAEKGGYRVGDTVPVALTGPAKTYRLSGIFTTENTSVAQGGSLVLFDTPVAQRLYLRPGVYESVTVTAAPGVSSSELAATVRKVLPDSATAKTGRQLADEEAKRAAADALTLGTLLLAFAGVALFVSVFLIANTFTMLAAQRTRELALLRAVGASRRQVTRSVLTEAMAVGVVASAAGLGLGAAIAATARSVADFGGGKIPDGPLAVTSTTVLVAVVVGVLVTMVAAWLPARRAAKIPPVAAIGSAHLPATTKSLVLRNTLGGIVTLLGAAIVVAGAGAGGSRGAKIVGLGAFFAVIGVIVLIPLLSRPVIAAVRPLLRRGFGISGKLAGQNAVRSPRRTGATASALAIGLTLVSGLTVLGATLGQSADRITGDIVKADYMVMDDGTGLDASAVAALRKVGGVSAVSQEQGGLMTVGRSMQQVSGVTAADFPKTIHLTVVSGSLDTLTKGQMAVADDVARSNGWKTGDTLPVGYEDSERGRLTVGAIFESNTVVSPVVVSTDVLKPHQDESRILWIYVKTDGSTKAKALADAVAAHPGATVGDRQVIRDHFNGDVDTTVNILYGLLAISLVIAVLGVVNTLAMSVFERQREVGMLRAVGLDRQGVTRMIQLESVVISLFGALIGLALGAFLGWAVCEATKADIPGYMLVLPWDRFGLFLLLAALVGLLAALWPARSAARLNMLTAIKAE